MSFAQDYTLKLTSNNKTEVLVLNEIEYLKEHKDTISLNLELNKVSIYLKNIGYFTNTIDSIKEVNKNYIAYFSLNTKIGNVVIKIDNESTLHFKNFKIKNSSISFPIKKLQSTLSNISKDLDKEGKSFSKVQLKNILVINKTLFADLDIHQSKKRIINKVIVKGYENFPNSFLKNYFNIKTNTVFNQEKIKKISEASRNLQFIKEIKPPEVLFTKDSTLIYMYVKKEQSNSFDGIVNFASKEDGRVLFNGNIDLKLNNVLNTGEKFELFWNSIGNERQEFKVLTEIPYIFNSAITPEFSFTLYKQDSTFINSKFDSKIKYNINNNLKIGISYSSESSESLLRNNSLNNTSTFTNLFIGANLSYSKLKRDLFYNQKAYFEINPFFGRRKANNSSSNQFKIKTIASYIWDINNRNSIYVRNETGLLNSDTYINNELFRIGGANSIRGFNEQSIFAQSYTYFNIEYRYLTSSSSYLYTITDIGNLKTDFTTENLIGIGLGYLFNINNSQVKLSTAFGKKSSQSFDFKQNKIIINWLSFF